MENITLSINGKNITCPPETSILEAAEQSGIKIPRLCYHPELEPAGACRLCIVEDEKRGRLIASCVAPVARDMVIRTDSPRIISHRRNIVRLMMAEHPESCLICGKGNRCRLRQIAGELGAGETRLYSMYNYGGFEEANPFIIRDLGKCILCGKCIRADQELVVAGAIDYNLRGFKSRPATLHGMPLDKSTCTFCGTCVSMCPTGALMVKNTGYVGSPQKESPTICGFCGVGCSLMIGSADGQIVEVNPSNKNDTVNRSTLCIRGHFAHDFLNAGERLTQPMIREEGELISVPWDEALDNIAGRLVDIKRRFGPQSVGFLGSSKCTNEENYLFQKMARVLMETNNVDNGGYLAGRSVLNLIDERTGVGGRLNSISALDKAESFFVLGANPSHSVPVISYYLKRAAKRGVPLIVADPGKTDLVPFSSVWLPVLPNKDLELINCLSALLWKKFAHDFSFIERFTEGFTAYNDSISSFNIELLCLEAGIDMESLEKVSDLLAGKKISFIVGHGILQQRNGAASMGAILNLSLMTGSLGRENRGIYVLAKENNQMGARDMGTVPDFLPGGKPISSDTERKQWEKKWGTGLSPDPGLDIIRMIEAAENGNLKALYIMGENPLRSLPQPERVGKALESLDFLVVQDILATETTEIADAVLPGSAFSEKGGSFTNLEGRIQAFEPVLSPPGQAKPDWEILDLLGGKMGYPKNYKSPGKITKEISQLVPMYEESGRKGEGAWIKDTGNLGLFHPDGKGERIPFYPVTSPADEAPDEIYHFKAILGSQRYHLGSGTRTGHSARIRALELKGEVEISPGDGSELGLKDGDTVRVSSPWGSIERAVKINKDLVSGIIFVPLAFHNNNAMHLLDLVSLDEAGFKECHVKIEKQKRALNHGTKKD